MKSILPLFFAFISITACNKRENHKENTTTRDSIVQDQSADENAQNKSGSLDINTIPVTNEDIGAFPYFTLPEGLEPQNKPLERKFDVCFFPINGVMTPVEGRIWKCGITAKRGEEFSQRYFEKSTEEYLTSLGAVKIFDGEITREEYDRYNKQDPNKGNEGDMGYAGQNIKVFVLRSVSQGNIYIQYKADNAMGVLNIVQEEGFKQTIKKITAAEITKDLVEKGKAVLYINFDIDKATLTAEGQELVKEIAKSLNTDAALKIAIEGHTDNSGNAAHNKKLSLDRATAVLSLLKSQGIAGDRLTSKGFGSEKPLVANDTEENKAKNRRVELIRVQ
jgi:OOP family OmpA-OmpF porin